GRRGHGLRALVEVPEIRSRRSPLAQPGPVRPLGRPCLDAPLLAPPPLRVRSLDRGYPGVPPVGIQDAGASGVRPHAGRRGEDGGRRFDAYGWGVQTIDGNDRDQVDQALSRAMADESRPSLIVARTIIAKGAPTKQGTAAAHGEPLGEEELKRAKEGAGWPL